MSLQEVSFARVYDIEPAIRERGRDVMCPKTGKLGSSYVHAVQGANGGGSNKRNSYGTIMKHGNKNNIAPANVYLEDILQLYRNMVTFTIRWSTLGHQQYTRIGVSYTCSD